MDTEALIIMMEVRDRISSLEASVDARLSGIELALAAHSAQSAETGKRVNEIEKYVERQNGFVKISLTLLGAAASIAAVVKILG